DFVRDGDLSYSPKKRITIPFDFPGFTLNTRSVKVFNDLYYFKARTAISRQKVHLDSFFYPLDAINQWNRIYGRRGFVQYQFILPKSESYSGMENILRKIAESGMASFLSVLKLHGQGNKNYLSFPMEGYSLALDFKIQPGLLDFLDALDKVVLRHKGRFYLTKDARLSKQTFERGYPDIDRFRSIRKQYGLDKKFQSLQSTRLGL
ncbi:MAG: FAD-binding protein, partial [Bacteroidota bacterium]